MKVPRSCPICGEDNHISLYRRNFVTLSKALVDGYDVVACPRCGFCFASGLPSQVELDEYYEGQSKYEHDDRGGAPSEYDTRRLPFAANIISEWLPDRNARILDIGCANGGLLAELRKTGYERVVGVDPSPGCARTAKQLYGIDVHVAPISRISPDLGSFDLVILGSVLEHIVDLRGTIGRIRKLLTDTGQVYVEVPDMTRCASLNDAPFQEFSIEHVNYFGPIALENLWRQNGFDTTAIRQTHIEHVPGLTVFEIKAMFHLSPHSSTVASPSQDRETQPEIIRYIERSRAKLAKVEQAINQLADSRQPVIIWGVGTHTQSLLATTRLSEVNIKAFVDSNSNYAGQKLCGVTIARVDELPKWDLPILISSQQFQEEIVETIQKKLKLPNRLITLYSVAHSHPEDSIK
jgi:SAM-dependent methyltransferase